MPIASTHHELSELGGGVFRHTQHMKPIGFYDGGTLRRIDPDWRQGNAELPHLITLARLMTGVDDEGMRRFYPTRELDRYLQIGTPYVKVAGVWRKVGFSGATRTANTITWSRTQADLRIIFGGHFCKLEIPLKGGYVPEGNQVAFPVGLQGLTRSGGNILRDGEIVCHLTPPDVYDATNPANRKPIDYQFTSLSGQPYLLLTLPSLAGMSQPVIDPTINLQPNAADGLDTHIGKGSPNNNAGVSTSLYCGGLGALNQEVRGLIKFTLSTLPAGAIVSVGSMSLDIDAEGNTTDRVLSVYRALSQWWEGSKNGAAPDPGTDGSTWNLRNANGAVAWLGGAGGGSGTDYAAVATASANVPSAAPTWVSWDVTVDVQAWASGTTNNGLWIINNDETTTNTWKRYCSSDHATALNRPKLDITYTLPQGGWGFPMRLGVPR